ncbi:Neudesin [Orbilia brochopaga]|nr:Neudesin [Drechslerella brochopaga]
MVQTRKQAREATPVSSSSADGTPSKQTPPPSAKKPRVSKAKLIEEEDRVSFGVLDLLRVLLGMVLFSCTLSYFIIGDSYIWGQEKVARRYWNVIRKTWVWMPGFCKTTPIYMDEATLALYNGTDTALPIYLSINGTIYDVSAGRSKYGPGGGYSFFAGRDASRAYITGDFKNDLTWDVTGIDEERVQQSLGHWVKFFANHDTYSFVGYLIKTPKANPPEPEPGHTPDEL